MLAFNAASDFQLDAAAGHQGHRDQRARPPEADRRRHRHLGHQLGGRLGDARRGRPAAGTGRSRPPRRCCTGSAARPRGDHQAATSGRSARPCRPGRSTCTVSYLAVREGETSGIGPFVPFLVAFGVIGLVMSVLIVANVVSGAVVSGYRRIGILKSIGFTPGQVISAYAGQVAIPAVTGCVLGVVLGNLLALPLLAKTANAFGVGALSVPLWVDVAVPLGMLAVVGYRRAGAVAARGAAERGPGHRAGPGPGHRPRLRRAPAAGPAPAAPPGEHRPGRSVRPARADRDHAGVGAARRDRGDLRRGAEQLADRRGERALTRRAPSRSRSAPARRTRSASPPRSSARSRPRCAPSRARPATRPRPTRWSAWPGSPGRSR